MGALQKKTMMSEVVQFICVSLNQSEQLDENESDVGDYKGKFRRKNLKRNKT